MTRTVFAVCLALALAVTLASAEERKATLTTADSAELPLSTRTTPVLVTNFPAVQGVEGTVNIGNLPTDENGNVRMTASPFSRVVRLFDGEVTLAYGETWESPVFDTADFSLFRIMLASRCANGDSGCAGPNCTQLAQWVEGEDWYEYPQELGSPWWLTSEVLGPRTKLSCIAQSSAQVVLFKVRVFLSQR